MFYKISQELANNLKSLLTGVFSDDDFQKGIEAFENLINIEDDKSNFNYEYGIFLNDSNILSPEWDVISGCRIEGFLRKIEKLKGNDTDGTMLQGYYTRIGFYNWLNSNDIKLARANDVINSSNADNSRGGEGFHLAEADATKYKGCSNFFDSYIVTYQLRNRTKAHDNPVDRDPIVRFEKIKSLFIVYLDQCIKNRDLIDGGYENELLSKRIDYVKYANDALSTFDEFNRSFLQLNWVTDENDQFIYDYKGCVKFIGEAGMGKTTQMKKMYYDILQSVKNGERLVLPLWIELANMSELQEVTLEETIREQLREYEQYYDLLLRRNIIALFLDGYNEVLSKDTQDIVKRKLAGDIDDIHKKYPETIIAMTDRCAKSVPPCLTKNVSVYTFPGLSQEEIGQYVKIKTDSDNSEKIIQYIDNEGGNWIGNTKIIPAKINSLIELISDDVIPEDEDDFYDKYLDFILEREAYEKKETRIEDLKYLLYILAQELNHPQDEKSQNEIIKLWLSEGQIGSLPEATRLFKLAIELPILVPGSSDRVYRFAYPQYYHKMYEGM